MAIQLKVGKNSFCPRECQMYHLILVIIDLLIILMILDLSCGVRFTLPFVSCVAPFICCRSFLFHPAEEV
jgi:hypothetical protein